MELKDGGILEDKESEFNFAIQEFSRYLKRKLKTKKVIELYVKNINQYMEWAAIEISNECLYKINKKNLEQYETYLKNEKEYQNITVSGKLRSLIVFNEFIVDLLTQNNIEDLLDKNKICKQKKQYNYITKTFIKL